MAEPRWKAWLERHKRSGRLVGPARSLQARFALSYGAIIVALILFLNTYPVLISQNLMFQSKEDTLRRQADIVTSTLAGSEALTAEGVEANLTKLGLTGVDRIMVTDPAGLVLYDTSQLDNASGRYALLWEVVTALHGNDVFRSEYREDAFRSRAASPIVYRGMTLGSVYLYEYDSEQALLLMNFQDNLRTISLLLCAAALVLSVIFSKAVTRRVGELLEGVRSVREGQYSHRVSVSGRDELALLADEFNELTDRLQTTEEVRRRFVSDASHELKTPLASIRLLTDSILQNDGMDPDTVQEFVSDIGEEAERLTRITEKLLALTRLDSGRAVARAAVDVGGVARKVERMLTPLARAVNVTLSLTLEEGCRIWALEDDIYQVAFNLMENAVKYNLPGGQVLVSLTKTGPAGDTVLLRGEDTGVGIPEEDLPKIFDRFYRVDKARSRAAGGTGLGLSIVRDTVRLHGGSVSVRGRAEKGTCFEVRFPLWREEKGETP